MLVAGSAGAVAGIDQRRGHTAYAPGIVAAGSRSDQTGIQTDRYTAHSAAVEQPLVGKPLMNRLHDLAPQLGRRVNTQIDLLRLVIAAPDSCRIMLGIAAEPAVLIIGGRTGLAGNGLSSEDGCTAGTAVGCVVQTVVHIIDGLIAENLLRSLGIINHQLTVTVVNLGIKSCFPINAVVCKGCIGCGHILNRGTQCQGTQCQRRPPQVIFHLAVRCQIVFRQTALTQIVLGKAVGIFIAGQIQSADGNGIDGVYNAVEYRSSCLIFPVIILRPVAAVVGNRQILQNCCGTDNTQLKSGGIDGNGLLCRTGLQLRLGGPVVTQEVILLTHAAGQSHNVAGFVVNNHDCRLKLLGTAGIRNVGQVVIDSVHLLLDIHIHSGIDMIAALLDVLQIDLLGSFRQIVPNLTVLFGKVRCEINDYCIHKPGIDVLGCIDADRRQASALGAVVIFPLMREGAANPFISAGVTYSPAILIGNAFLEDHFLSNCFCIFFIGQVSLIPHFTEDIQLTVTVTACAVPFLSLIHINTFRIRIKHGRVIGNADQGRTFGSRQALEFLAEIFRSSTLDTVAAAAQIDLVQVILHDQIFIVFPLKHLGTEDFHHLTLNGNTLLAGMVLNKLLGDGRTAELIIAAEEHIQTGLHRSDPVNTLVFIKTLVFNGHSRINQILGNLFQRCPLTVCRGVNLLQLLNIAVIVHIINKGGFLQIVVIYGPVGSFHKNILLQIVAQGANKNHAADQHDQHYRNCRTHGNLEQR